MGLMEGRGRDGMGPDGMDGKAGEGKGEKGSEGERRGAKGKGRGFPKSPPLKNHRSATARPCIMWP